VLGVGAARARVKGGRSEARGRGGAVAVASRVCGAVGLQPAVSIGQDQKESREAAQLIPALHASP